MNLPNLITIIRIAFVPDGVDGAIARRKNLVTNLGKLLDPIADKALLGGALVSLSILGEVPWWITTVILVREIGITAYRLIVVKKRVIAAAGGGKLKTILQSIAV
ncbi:MAG: CDP-diacylglycerol--glycerol-3-phosphate 3-phosphatidyltransferase, partial [Actinomycetota bacterium]